MYLSYNENSSQNPFLQLIGLCFCTQFYFILKDLLFIILSLISYLWCYVLQQNRPLNSQVVADFLQKFNLKKTAVQKALDNLADSGKITFKEYGKQKIYLARQDQFQIPNTEELNQMKEENARLQEMLEEQKKANSQLEGGTLSKTVYYIVL